MDIKIKKIIGLVFVMLSLISCTKVEPECNSGLGQAFINDLIKITPLQSTYNQGDEIIIKLSVPANNTYFNNMPRNILLETQSVIASIAFGSLDPFIGNQVTIVKDTQGKYPNQFDFLYSQDYELDLRIKLNKVGNYSFFTFESLGFGQLKDCKYFNIKTNIEGQNADGKIEFVVQ